MKKRGANMAPWKRFSREVARNGPIGKVPPASWQRRLEINLEGKKQKCHLEQPGNLEILFVWQTSLHSLMAS